MLSQVMLGSDKTTVSVGTGNTEFHPLYLSIGNVHNSVRRAHKDAVVPIGFLAIPKGEPLHHISIPHIFHARIYSGTR